MDDQLVDELLVRAQAEQIHIIEVNQPDRGTRRRRGKTDSIDARTPSPHQPLDSHKGFGLTGLPGTASKRDRVPLTKGLRLV